MLLWTSQYSELAHQKQPEIIANVLMFQTKFAQRISKKRFRTIVGLSMDMKYECEAGYIKSHSWQAWTAMSNPNGLLSQKLCHCLGRTLNDILLRAAHWMTYFDLSKLNLALSKCTESIRTLTATVTDVINRHWGPPALKCHIKNCQNKDRLLVYGIPLLQRKFRLGRTKPSTGPHAARAPRVWHSWARIKWWPPDYTERNKFWYSISTKSQ